MFGIIRPCRHRLSESLQTSWVAHLCGLCLALRDDHGQFARVATNYDGMIISVLVEAQTTAEPGAGRRSAGPCPLRGMRSAEVAHGEGARLAAAVSLVLASAKVRDHVADGDGAMARRPVAAAARRVADRWDRKGASRGAEIGFDTAVLVDAVERQLLVESASTGPTLLEITEPTETASAAACAHTAVLAGRPGNREPLAEIGRLFGRLAHLLDAVEDLEEDTRTGAWNPLTATGTSLEEAHRLCVDALHGVRLALKDVEFTDGKLAHVLLAHELQRSVDRAFGTRRSHTCSSNRTASSPPPGYSPFGPGGPVMPPPPEPPRRGPRRGRLAGCLVFTGLFCSFQVCCRDTYIDPWSGEEREGACRDCDGCDSCGECCNCDCCSCDGCDGCDCGC